MIQRDIETLKRLHEDLHRKGIPHRDYMFEKLYIQYIAPGSLVIKPELDKNVRN